MEDLKRLIFPAIAALVLHGFLISFNLPKHERLKPILQGNPIKVEISTFSSQAIVPKKKEENKKAENIVKPETPPKVVRKEIVTQPSINIPKKNIQKTQQKVAIKPKQIKKYVVVEKRAKISNLQHNPQHSQQENSVKTAPEKENDKAVVLQKTAIPMYRENKHPPYPVMARRRGYEGKILLDVLVNSRGLVSDIKIKHSSGHQSLDTAAVETVKNWLFTPASEGGRPVSMWIDVPIEFELK